MSSKSQYHPADRSLKYIDMSEDQLKELWTSWYPMGSGPLSAMRVICGLIESIAHLRGFDTLKWNDSHPREPPYHE